MSDLKPVTRYVILCLFVITVFELVVRFFVFLKEML